MSAAPRRLRDDVATQGGEALNRVTIRRFEVVRTANVVAVLYAVSVVIFGLLFVVPFVALGGLASLRGGGGVGVALGAGIAGGLVFLVLGIVVYGIMGWIGTAIACALYNFVAGRVGGIRVIVDVEDPYPGAPGYGGPGYPAGYGAPGYGAPGYGAPGYGAPPWPAPGSPGAPTPPPTGWGQPGG